MDTQLKNHIETLKEVFEVLHTSDYNHTDLKYRLNLLIDYLQTNRQQELERQSLESIERDAQRLKEIGRRLQKLGAEFERLEAKI